MATQASYSSTVAGTAPATIIDVNHPFFLSSSDNPGMSLTTIVLTEQNYSQWSRSMEIALSSKMKIGFVDGSISRPASNSRLLSHWNRCNHMVISWLLNSVSSDIRNSIVYINTAFSIWTELAIRYAQSNLPKLFNLRKEITQLSQGTMSITTHYTRYKTLIDELESLTSRPKCDCLKCTCEINNKLNDENQRDVQGMTGINPSNVALNVRSDVSGHFGTKGVTNPQNSGGFMKKNASDSPIICEFCQMHGHTKDKCFCVVGYPSWRRLFGKPKPKPRLSAPQRSTAAQVAMHSIESTGSLNTNSQDVSGSPSHGLSDS
ncbi:uncharacterized protein LOC141691382 [Apium graveolens]|uniref:uncharacterized protein LOC141691382 n=1 Tax=Apium graveolens TaxID=4045 RepID=UPI003D7C0D2B